MGTQWGTNPSLYLQSGEWQKMFEKHCTKPTKTYNPRGESRDTKGRWPGTPWYFVSPAPSAVECVAQGSDLIMECPHNTHTQTHTNVCSTMY